MPQKKASQAESDILKLEDLLSTDPNSKMMIVSHVPFGQSYYPEDAFAGLVKTSDALGVKRWVVSDLLYANHFKSLDYTSKTKAEEREEIKLLSEKAHSVANRIIMEKGGNITKSYAYLLAEAEIAKEGLKELKKAEKIDYLLSEENDFANINTVYNHLWAQEFYRVKSEKSSKKDKVTDEINSLKEKKKGLGKEDADEKREIDNKIAELKAGSEKVSITEIKKNINEYELRRKAFDEYKSLLKSLHPSIVVAEGKSPDEPGAIDETILGKRISIKADHLKEPIKENTLGRFRKIVETDMLRKVKDNIYDIYITMGKYGTYASSYLKHDDRLDIYSTFMATPAFEDYPELYKLVTKHNLKKHPSAQRANKRVQASSGALLLDLKNPVSDYIGQPMHFWFRLNDLRNYKNKTDEEIRKTELVSIMATSCWHGGSGNSVISNSRAKGYKYMDYEVDEMFKKFHIDLFAFMGDAVKGTNYPESATETSAQIPQEFLAKFRDDVKEVEKAYSNRDKESFEKALYRIYSQTEQQAVARNETNLDKQLDEFLFYFRKFTEPYIDKSLYQLSERIKRGELKGRVPEWEFLKLMLISGNHYHHTLVKGFSDMAPGKSESMEIWRDLRGMVEEKMKKYDLDKIMVTDKDGRRHNMTVDYIMKAPLAEYVGYYDGNFYGHRVLMKHKFGVGQEGWSSFNPLAAFTGFMREGVTKKQFDVAIGAHYHYAYLGSEGDTFCVTAAGQEESNAYSKDAGGKGKFFAPAHFGPYYVAIPNGKYNGPMVSWFVASDVIRDGYLKKHPEDKKLFDELENTDSYMEISKK